MSLLARLFNWLRRKPQQPVLDEQEAYERCHGERTAEIQVMAVPKPKPRVLPRLGGDYLQRCFEERLDARRPGRRLGGGVEVAGESEPLGGVEPEDEGLAGRVDEDPLELLRRKAMAAAHRSGSDDSVEPLDVPEALERVGHPAPGLDPRIHV
jgi:hypothetical protein